MFKNQIANFLYMENSWFSFPILYSNTKLLTYKEKLQGAAAGRHLLQQSLQGVPSLTEQH